MAQQTAVDYLISELKTYVLKKNDIRLIRPCLDKAKEMEKEQIMKAYQDAYFPCSHYGSEQYYNETFGK